MGKGGILLNRSRQVPAEDSAAFGGVAERFRRAGDLDRAIALCREGLRKFPHMLSARVTLGWALLDKGEYEQARVELEQVLKRAPDNLAAIRGLAELHDRQEVGSIEDHGAWQSSPAEGSQLADMAAAFEGAAVNAEADAPASMSAAPPVEEPAATAPAYEPHPITIEPPAAFSEPPAIVAADGSMAPVSLNESHAAVETAAPAPGLEAHITPSEDSTLVVSADSVEGLFEELAASPLFAESAAEAVTEFAVASELAAPHRLEPEPVGLVDLADERAAFQIEPEPVAGANAGIAAASDAGLIATVPSADGNTLEMTAQSLEELLAEADASEREAEGSGEAAVPADIVIASERSAVASSMTDAELPGVEPLSAAEPELDALISAFSAKPDDEPDEPILELPAFDAQGPDAMLAEVGSSVTDEGSLAGIGAAETFEAEPADEESTPVEAAAAALEEAVADPAPVAATFEPLQPEPLLVEAAASVETASSEPVALDGPVDVAPPEAEVVEATAVEASPPDPAFAEPGEGDAEPVEPVFAERELREPVASDPAPEPAEPEPFEPAIAAQSMAEPEPPAVVDEPAVSEPAVLAATPPPDPELELLPAEALGRTVDEIFIPTAEPAAAAMDLLELSPAASDLAPAATMAVPGFSTAAELIPLPTLEMVPVAADVPALAQVGTARAKKPSALVPLERLLKKIEARRLEVRSGSVA